MLKRLESISMWTNISAYKFLDMPEYEELREPLKQFCDSHGIYGTILLSPEGINIFLSAPREKIDIFVHIIVIMRGVSNSKKVLFRGKD